MESVSTQDVRSPQAPTLAVQSISISKIKPNPNNPRHMMRPEAVEALAASMKAAGQETPIKVRKLGVRSEELGVKGQNQENQKPEIPTPPNDPIGSGARNDNNYEYELIGGHLRLEAAKKLGWESLNAIVLELTPDQVELAAILDNRGEDMHWLDWYQAIERRWNSHSKPTQRIIADELGISAMTVNRALKVTNLLTSSARQLLVTQCYKNPDDEGLSERTVRALTDLGDAQKVEEALKVAVDRQMTEAEAKKLVDWIKKGQKAEDYGKKPEIATSQTEPIGSSPRNDGIVDPNAEMWEGLPRHLKIQKIPDGYKLAWLLSDDDAPVAIYGAMAWLEQIKALTHNGYEANLKYNNAWPKLREKAEKAKAAAYKQYAEASQPESQPAATS